MNGHSMSKSFSKNLKSISVCSLCAILLACSMPNLSIRSQASGLEAYLAANMYEIYYGFLSSYLISHGYGEAKISQDPSNTYVGSAGSHAVQQLIDSFLEKLRLANAVQAEMVARALKRAGESGIFSLSEDTEAFLKEYLDSITIDSQVVLGQSVETFYPLTSDDLVDFSIVYYKNSAGSTSLHTTNYSISCPYDFLPVLKMNYDSYGLLSSAQYYFLPTENYTRSEMESFLTDFNITYVDESGMVPAGDGTYRLINLGDQYCISTNFVFSNSNFTFTSFDFFVCLTVVGVANSVLNAICNYLIQNGYYDNSVDLVANQVTDTSNIDILSSATEIEPDGTVAGGFTYYMRDQALLQQIIRQFTEGVLSWTQAMKALGLSQVASDATVAEKEQAQEKVAYPDSTYDWFTSTTWGESLTSTVSDEIATTHENELALTDEIADSLNGGNEPSDEDKNKAANSMLIASLLMWLGIWEPPEFDPTDPNPGGIDEEEDPDDPYDSSDYLVDTIAGTQIVGGIVADIFNSAGGSNGFGIIYTLGASFVIFSVIIGAGNFFGAMGEIHGEADNYASSRMRSAVVGQPYNQPRIGTSKGSKRSRKK